MGRVGGFDPLARWKVPETRLYGVDLLAERFSALADELPGAHLAQADARQSAWRPQRFWLVTIFLVLSSENSTESQKRTLAEATRVLQPGGHLFVWEPRWPNPLNRAARLVRRSTLDAGLGKDLDVEAVTVLPALARRLRSAARYRALARTRLMCSHRLVHFTKPP